MKIFLIILVALIILYIVSINSIKMITTKLTTNTVQGVELFTFGDLSNDINNRIKNSYKKMRS